MFNCKKKMDFSAYRNNAGSHVYHFIVKIYQQLEYPIHSFNSICHYVYKTPIFDYL